MAFVKKSSQARENYKVIFICATAVPCKNCMSIDTQQCALLVHLSSIYWDRTQLIQKRLKKVIRMIETKLARRQE